MSIVLDAREEPSLEAAERAAATLAAERAAILALEIGAEPRHELRPHDAPRVWVVEHPGFGCLTFVPPQSRRYGMDQNFWQLDWQTGLSGTSSWVWSGSTAADVYRQFANHLAADVMLA